jgi:hypothetical protein
MTLNSIKGHRLSTDNKNRLGVMMISDNIVGTGDIPMSIHNFLKGRTYILIYIVYAGQHIFYDLQWDIGYQL